MAGLTVCQSDPLNPPLIFVNLVYFRYGLMEWVFLSLLIIIIDRTFY